MARFRTAVPSMISKAIPCARDKGPIPEDHALIIGIGAVERSSMLSRTGNVFSARELGDVSVAGRGGNMSLWFFDADAALVKMPLDDRVTP